MLYSENKNKGSFPTVEKKEKICNNNEIAVKLIQFF